MSDTLLPRRVAVIGAGTIGASWAACFLSQGIEVSVFDPAPDAADRLNGYVDRIWPLLTRIGLKEGADRDKLAFTHDLEVATRGAGFVQENGPEREELKIRLFAEIDACTPAGTIIASSSSGLTMSTLQATCRHPERCVIGHPFNPPHLIPLVEVVGGRLTSAETIRQACDFYAALDKKPIVLRKEVPGHVANRLQAALWREAVHLVNEGVVSVADVDEAVASGPGLRWALMGPNLVFHLGGGQGGMEHFLAHLAGPFSRWWNDLGRPELTPELCARLAAGVQEEVAGRSVSELEARRDELLRQIIALKAGS